MAPTSRELTGASAIVLGAAGGIGSACVRRLTAAGAHVVAVDRADTVAQLPDCTAVIGDVTDPSVLRQAFDSAPTRPTILVHAVLSEHRAPLEQLTLRDWRAVLDTGLLSAWQAGVELLTSADGQPASMVLVGSVHAHGAAPMMAPYAVSKAGLTALARAMATEWGPRGLRCNVVEPGFVKIARNEHRWADDAERDRILSAYPLRRLCEPEEIAEVIAFLAGPASSYVNGTCLVADGGSLAVLPEVITP